MSIEHSTRDPGRAGESQAEQGNSRRWRRVCKRWSLPMPHGWTPGLLDAFERAHVVVVSS